MYSHIIIIIGNKYYKELNENDFELTDNIINASKISDKLDLWSSLNGYTGFIYSVLKKKYSDCEIKTMHYCQDSNNKFIEVEDLRRVW